MLNGKTRENHHVEWENYGIITIFNEKTPYFDWAMFNREVLVIAISGKYQKLFLFEKRSHFCHESLKAATAQNVARFERIKHDHPRISHRYLVKK